jgi:secretion/DNA translocation related TadE-like protein
VNDDGTISVLMLALLALAALVCLATADAANVLLARSRARSAADAAALAAASAQWSLDGATDPSAIAGHVAEANGAMLTSCDCEHRGTEAVVVVSVPTRIRLLGAAPREVSASATAALDPGRVFSAPG